MKEDRSSIFRLTALVIAVALAIVGFAAVLKGSAQAEDSHVLFPADSGRQGLEPSSDPPLILGALHEFPEDDTGDGTPASEDGREDDTRETGYPAVEATSSDRPSDPAQGIIQEPPNPTDGAVATIRTYTVQSGDNLTYIAELQYGIADDHAAYLEALAIWDLNRELIGPDPDVIRPGQALNLAIRDQLAAQSEDGYTSGLTTGVEAGPTAGTDRVPDTGFGEPGGGVATGLVVGESAPTAELLPGPVEDVTGIVTPREPSADRVDSPRPSSDTVSVGGLDIHPTILMTFALVIAIALAVAVWAGVTELGAAAAARASRGGKVTANSDPQRALAVPAVHTPAPVPVQAIPSGNGQFSASSAVALRRASAPLVLLAHGDLATASLMARELASEGLAVVALRSGGEALLYFEETRPDIVIIDQSMPDVHGVAVMQGLRHSASVPIILLLDVDDTAAKIRGLDFGADDCLTKPVNTAELSARIRAVLRRTNGGPKPHEFHQVIQVKDLEIDLLRRLVRRNGHLVELTPTEWQLLRYLALNAGRVVSKEEILVSIWGREYHDADHYLRTWIPRLRRRLRSTKAADAIKTIHGMGYVLDISDHQREGR